MGRARPKGENEGRGKTSGATPGIPFAFVRHAFSLSLPSFFLSSLFLHLLSIHTLHTRVSSRSHTDINRTGS